MGGTVAEWADRLGVSSKTFSRWEKSIPIPSDKLSLLAEYGWDVNYILTGERSPRAGPSALSPEDEAVLALWHQTPARERAHIRAILDALAGRRRRAG